MSGRFTPFYRGRQGVLNLVMTVGQSLGAGVLGTPVVTTMQTRGNVQLSDSSLNYDITNPSLATLSLIPLVCPVRANVFTGVTSAVPYPGNIGGETAEVSMVNQLSAMLGLRFATSNVAIPGEPYAYVGKGGTGNAYAAGLWEARRIRQLSGGLVPFATLCMHGEADSGTDQSVYEGDLYKWQRDLEADLNVACETLGRVPMFIFQQSSTPTAGSGWPTSTLSQWRAILDYRGRIIGVNPHFPYSVLGSPDDVHFLPPGYIAQGEMAAYAATQWLANSTWMPFVCTGVARTGSSQFTATFNVPVTPMIIASTSFGTGITAPHGAGTRYGSNGAIFPGSNGWTNAYGFEVWDGGLGGTPVPISSFVLSGNTAVVNFTGTANTLAYGMTPDKTTTAVGCANFPDGRCGMITDSTSFTGLSGKTQPFWLHAFSVSGL